MKPYKTKTKAMDEESTKIIDFTPILEAEAKESEALLDQKILALLFYFMQK